MKILKYKGMLINLYYFISASEMESGQTSISFVNGDYETLDIDFYTFQQFVTTNEVYLEIY